MRHSKKACHKEKRKPMRENQSLPAAFEATQQKIDGVAIHPGHGALPYGCAPNVQLPSCEKQPSTDDRCPKVKKPVRVTDRVAHQETLICTFIAKHSLPMTHAPQLIALAQELSGDPAALSQLKMERSQVPTK
ncbi:hypothetical protein PoB_005097400 [Plakobranchus ocellatus]|uniref:Uncharacterized protein n=1 Tax=Plakobranchus ocellatus TaxID=259542 RepID=A0AAV4BW91_9GAST|nr:hypothetical protein PoB_005097400 [Plakobranchus ocellatus]